MVQTETARAEAVLTDLLGFSYLTKAELYFLQGTAARTPQDANLVNIGAGVGTSGLGLLLTRPEGVVWTVDFAGEENPYGGLRNEMIALERAGLIPGILPDHYHQLLGDSRDVGRNWFGGPVDLVFVDDGHEYDETLGDIKIWGALIKPGGFILVHDFEKENYYLKHHPNASAEEIEEKAKAFPGLDQAVREELFEKHPAWKYAGIVDTLIAFQKAL